MRNSGSTSFFMCVSTPAACENQLAAVFRPSVVPRLDATASCE